MRVEVEVRNLLEEMVELFQERKKSKKISERSHRGRAISAANEFEGKIAVLIEKALPDKYSFLVDYPLSYNTEGGKGHKTCYPDVAIVKDSSVLVAIIELKIDLGYLPPDWVNTSRVEFENLSKAERVGYKINIGRDKATGKELRVAEKLNRAIVLLTSKNDHGRFSSFSKQKNCFVLSYNVHPNDYAINDDNKKDFLEKIFSHPENTSSWRKFSNFLQNNFD